MCDLPGLGPVDFPGLAPPILGSKFAGFDASIALSDVQGQGGVLESIADRIGDQRQLRRECNRLSEGTFPEDFTQVLRLG